MCLTYNSNVAGLIKSDENLIQTTHFNNANKILCDCVYGGDDTEHMLITTKHYIKLWTIFLKLPESVKE